MKNNLGDLTNHLFAQLERLGDEDMTPEQIEKEVSRAKAMVDVADTIVATADVQLKAAKLFGEYGTPIVPHLPMIGSAVKPAKTPTRK